MNINLDEIINSPIERHQFEEKMIYVKRDDLLGSDFSGNKARKFYYYLHHDFPSVKKIISFGSAQSNAMYSLSCLAKMKAWAFEYHVEHIAEYLEQNPHGNYKYALENGMQLQVGEDFSSFQGDEVLFIEEGGREKEAEFGLKILAGEIMAWKKENKIEALNIFLPAGTGTTALYLQKALFECQEKFLRVYTVPCVGDVAYLKKQFLMLEKNEALHPQILVPSKKRHFGKLYRESYNIWLKLQAEMGVEFDLLYDPHGWLTLLENPQILKIPTLYIHQGGLIGNESMLARYKRKYNENT